jgi:hypothetical protein
MAALDMVMKILPPQVLVDALDAMTLTERLAAMLAFQIVWSHLQHDPDWKQRMADTQIELRPSAVQYRDIRFFANSIAADINRALAL